MDRSTDRKARASGEREEDLPQKPPSEPLHAYAQEALDHLLIFTRATMEDEEQILWIDRLSKYPRWKLNKLADFSSPYINTVWEFLDNLKQEPEYFQEPTRKQIEHKSKIAKSVLEHVFYLYKISEPIHEARGRLRRLQERQNKAVNKEGYTVRLVIAKKALKEALRAKWGQEKEALLKLQETFPHLHFQEVIKMRNL